MKCISLEYKRICFEIHLSDEIRNKIKLSIKHFMLSLRLLFKIRSTANINEINQKCFPL